MRTILLLTAVTLSLAAQLRAANAGEPLPEVTIELVAEGLNAPIFLVAPDDGSGRRFIGEQAGDVTILDPAGKRMEAPFLDLRASMVT